MKKYGQTLVAIDASRLSSLEVLRVTKDRLELESDLYNMHRTIDKTGANINRYVMSRVKFIGVLRSQEHRTDPQMLSSDLRIEVQDVSTGETAYLSEACHIIPPFQGKRCGYLKMFYRRFSPMISFGLFSTFFELIVFPGASA
ncbi:hypothetical protein BYT27DRAFT_6367725 [Phlegmacium glaucopus]|nr:hypothetical protein BYT27DRAFT_6367725 [Phlegmacium glaucopus]